MTTLPNDPPTDDDDWSHEQLAHAEEPAADPDELDAYSEEDLDDLDDLADEDGAGAGTASAGPTYPDTDDDEN